MVDRRCHHSYRRPAVLSPIFSLYWFFTFSLVISGDAVFSPATNYLLNCGSAATREDERSFVSDDASLSSTFSLSTHRDISISDPSPPQSLSTIYLSARVFTSPSSYSFPISSSSSPIFVRLHFYPFISPPYNLSTAIFNVSASGSPLLTRFRPPVYKSTVEEFLFWFNLPKLELKFSPNGDFGSDLAFVNAIEIFSATSGNIPDSARRISAAGMDTGAKISEQKLRIVHRVNVGGPRVSALNDTLWRTWLPDGGYLSTPANQSNSVVFSGVVNFQDGGATPEIAPNSVYATAREMIAGGAAKLHNLTWIFPLPERRRYLVRLHFCDIVSSALYNLYFNLYINGILAMSDIDLSSLAPGPMLASPYYADFMLEPNNNGELQVTVGVSDRSLPSLSNAILNGIEVMEMIGEGKFTETGNSRRGLFLILGLVLGSLFVFCSIVAISFSLVLRRRKKIYKEKQFSGNPPLQSFNLSLKIPYSEILLATGNFSGENLIGSGGFGQVYKGILQDGTRVAVKRAIPGAGQGLPEFITEIQVLSNVRHRHLVSFLGYSTSHSELILVYEFMPEGSLRDNLYGTGNEPLPWKRRLEICVGAAKGLHYLHTGSNQVFIHRDVKSSNILIAGATAKVADFGLCKQAPIAEASKVITGVKGSFGYLDPEYLKTQQLTCKSDVYSFGVVLMEALCGRAAIVDGAPWEEVNLAEWALKWHKQGMLEEVVDPAIRASVERRSLVKYGDIAAACLATSSTDRPSMSDVVWSLENALKLQESHERSLSDDGRIVQEFEDQVPSKL